LLVAIILNIENNIYTEIDINIPKKPQVPISITEIVKKTYCNFPVCLSENIGIGDTKRNEEIAINPSNTNKPDA